MPAYDYTCADCGVFTELRSMAEFSLPADCPHCGAQSPRLLIAAPSLTGLRPPRWMTQAKAAQKAPPRLHSGGCGCCGSRPRPSLQADAVLTLPTSS